MRKLKNIAKVHRVRVQNSERFRRASSSGVSTVSGGRYALGNHLLLDCHQNTDKMRTDAESSKIVIALSGIEENTYLQVSVIVVLADAPSRSTSILSIVRKVSAICFCFSLNLLRCQHGGKLQNQYFSCLGSNEEQGRSKCDADPGLMFFCHLCIRIVFVHTWAKECTRTEAIPSLAFPFDVP